MYKKLEQKIAYTFKNRLILKQALTHASKSAQHLERQEFLGDAVLDLVMSQYLYEKHPDSAEGDLSKMRAHLVCKTALLITAKKWHLADILDVGDGERSKQGVLKSPSIAANAVESVIGAVFQDGGWDAAKQVVIRGWQGDLEHVKPINLRDAKSELQELTQAHALGLPNYKVQDLGLNHTPRFRASCLLHLQILGEGEGDRKKVAEINAAKEALKNEVLARLIEHR